MDAEAGIGEQASKYIYRITRDHELKSIHGPAWMRVGSLHGGGPELRRIGRGWVGSVSALAGSLGRVPGS